MKEPSLKETTIISVLIHTLVLFMAFFVVKGSSRITLPSPYVVTLVSPPELKRPSTMKPSQKRHSGRDVAAIRQIKRQRREAIMKSKRRYKKTIPGKKARQDNSPSYEEVIAALKAKRNIEQRVLKKRQILSVRKRYLSSEDEAAGSRPQGNNPGDIISSYYSQVQERIWSEWVLPEFRIKGDLLAIINIRIMKDGRINILGVEKSSGNSLFDRSAIRAIRKASPLPPPPYEIEIGVRFTP